MCSAQLGHLHGDEHLRRTSGVGAAQGSDVAVVSTVAHSDVVLRDPGPQSGVEGDPSATPPLDPGMAFAFHHRVGPAVAAWVQVAGDVAGRQAYRSQCTEGEMGEVLADPLAARPAV